MVMQFLPADEQRLYDDTVHGLRSQGWSRSDAEAEAIDRIITRRDSPTPTPEPHHD